MVTGLVVAATPVTLTVCGINQLLASKTSGRVPLAAATVTMLVSSLRMLGVTMTLSVGSEFKVTV